MNDFETLRQNAQRYKLEYPPGTRVEMLQMQDPWGAVEPGVRGTVIHVDDIGQLHMAWDNGRSLSLIPTEDKFRKLTPEEIPAETEAETAAMNPIL